jgi:MFS family permease
MSNSTIDIQNRVRRYWIEDGIPDLIIGSSFFIYSALLWWDAHSNQNWVNIISTIALVLMVIFGRMLIEKIKESFTFPRTGYAKYASVPLERKARRVMFGLGIATFLALLVIIAVVVGGESAGSTFVWILIPLLLSFFIGSIAYNQKSSRYYFYTIISLICGLISVLIAQGFSLPTRNAILNGVGILLPLGLIMIIGGFWTFRNYLSRNPNEVDDL